MKISIWQQFSSNHSNSFTVVGHFKTEADAQTATETLREIFDTIAEASIGYYDKAPLPVEIAYGEQYDIEWDEHLDYVYGHDHVIPLDKMIFVGPMRGDATWLGAYVVDELVEKLGARVQKEAEMRDYCLEVNITAKATSSEQASQLQAQIRAFLDDNNDYMQEYPHPVGRYKPAPPWVWHFKNKPDMPNADILDAHQQYNAQSRHIQNIREKRRALLIAGVSETDKRILDLDQQLTRPWDSPLPSAIFRLSQWYWEAVFNTSPLGEEKGYERMTVSANGETLTLENLWFSHHLGYALPALVKWLREIGCTVEYSFEERLED